ncbi:hypothetical protein FRC08_010495, partial [Ceratobasidium sp. 394]
FVAATEAIAVSCRSTRDDSSWRRARAARLDAALVCWLDMYVLLGNRNSCQHLTTFPGELGNASRQPQGLCKAQGDSADWREGIDTSERMYTP